MSNDATIVAASLSDEELKKSINALVSVVEGQTQAMATAFDDAVGKMTNALKNLTASSNQQAQGSQQRAKAVKEESQAIQTQAMSYDALAKAMQQASQQSARRFEVTDLQTLRMQQHELESLIKIAERRNPTILTFIKQEADQLAQSLQRLTQKKEQIQSKGILSQREANNVKQIEAEIQRLSDRYTQLSKQFHEADTLDSLRRSYEQVQQQIRQMGQSMIEADNAEKQLIRDAEQKRLAEEQAAVAARKATEEAKKQAEEEKKAARDAKQRAKELRQEKTLEVDKALGMSESNEEALRQKLEAIKKLRDELADKGILSQPKVNQMNRAIESLEKKLNKITAKQTTGQQLNMNNVLGMSEKTLDDISRKMQAITQLRGTLNIQTQKSEINQLNAEYTRLGKMQNEVLGKNILLERSNRTLASAFGYLRNRIIYAFTLGAMTNFTKQIYEVRGQYELLERSLGVLVNSFEKGSQIFQELNAMAIKSPFTLMELAGAAKQLTAYNFAANEVVDTTRRLADLSAALGVPMERLTYNLGQIRAQTVLTARDARDFANAGLPIVKSLADYFTELEGKVVSTGDVYDRMSKKMVSYTDVMAVLNRMTDEGGKFFDFQAKQAETLRVQMANLTLAFNNMLNEFGESSQGALTFPIQALKTLLLNWRTLNKVIWDVVAILGVYKTTSLITNTVIGRNNAGLEKQIITLKKLRAVELERKSLTEKLTVTEARLLATRNSATAADYRLVLSSRNLTKQQAMLLVAFNRGNTELIKAITSMKLLTEAEVQNITTGKILSMVIGNVGLALKGVLMSVAAILPALAGMAVIGGVVHLWQMYSDAAENVANVNRGIAESSKEAADALDKFLTNKGNMATRELAKQSKLTAEDGEKAWESLSEQLSTSAQSANALLTELMAIPDINKRVEKGFEYAGKIRAAQIAMQDLGEETIKVSHTTLGEGLVDDLKDYVNTYKEYLDAAKASGLDKDSVLPWLSNLTDIKDTRDEFEQELDVTAQSIKNFIVEHNITDPLQINEIVAMVKAKIKSENPKIQGELEKIFDVSLDQRMAQLTMGAVDANASLWKIFMDRLKSHSRGEFDNISQDIYDQSKDLNDVLSEEAQRAIDDNVEAFRTEMPLYYDAIKTMVDDANKLRIHIGLDFGPAQLTGFQREMKSRLDKAAKVLDFGGAELDPLQNEDYIEYVKRLRDERKKLNEENEVYAKDETEFSKNQISLNKTRMQQIENRLDLLHQTYAEEKETARKDPLGDAISKEVQIIGEAQKRLKEYLQMGASMFDATNNVAKEYNKTLAQLNKELEHYGLKGLTSEQIAKMDNREIVDFYKSLLDGASASAKGVETLDKAIANLNVDITKADYKKITDGLNNELSKLKDEYELAVELNANPELGDMFLDMFGLGAEDLPRSFGEAFDRANDIARDKLKKLKIDLADFDLMSTVIKGDDDNKWMGLEIDSEPIKELLKWQQTWRDMFKKNITETEKMLDDYVKKYGNYSDRIAEIEADRLQKLKQLNEAYYNDEMRKRPEYLAKLNAIEQGAIREKGAIGFDEFKNTQLYIAMFENLRYASTATLETIRQKLQDLKSEMGTLSPEQLKQVTQQYEKLNQELLRRNPFKDLIKNAKDYASALGNDGKRAQKAFVEAQRNYDAQLLVVTALKEQVEQKKAQEPTDKEGLLTLLARLSSEEDILARLKEELQVADELNNKYNLMRTIFNKQAKAVGNTVNMIGQNLQSIAELRDSLQTMFNIDLGDTMNALIDDLSQVGAGLKQIVSSATSGDVFGVLGGVVNTIGGVFDGIASIFGGGAARTRRINREINKSKESVRLLTMAYTDLERAVDKSLGKAETQARRSAIANKEAQLAEIERQMVLEQSKRSKDRDDDAIKQYQEEIQTLRNEIQDLKDDLVSNLLGSDVKQAAEAFVDTWVSAWKEGETTLDAIQGKMDEMIEHLIMKAATSKIVAALLDPLYKSIDQYTQNYSEGGVDLTTNELKALAALSSELGVKINDALGAFYGNLENLGIITQNIQEGDKQLSALQAGIQNVTEQTANAIEGYLNGISQQAYLRNDLLTQIRDAVVVMDGDMSNATQAQILLQLQSSYQVMMAIQSTLQGWSNASGMAMRVELI